MRRSRQHDKVLLVEGPDDQEVVYQFCNRCGIDNQAHFDVVPCEGYDELCATLRRELRAATETIGILVDADADPTHRWRPLQAILARHYSEDEPRQGVPEQLEPGGLVLDRKARWHKRCGVWIMPGDGQGGMLEDFLLALIPESDLLLAYSRQVVAGLPEQRFIPAHRAKAEVHTWLAWQEQPGTHLGLALKRRYLDADRTLARQFHDWLVRLFLVDDTSQDRLAGG